MTDKTRVLYVDANPGLAQSIAQLSPTAFPNLEIVSGYVSMHAPEVLILALGGTIEWTKLFEDFDVILLDDSGIHGWLRSGPLYERWIAEGLDPETTVVFGIAVAPQPDLPKRANKFTIVTDVLMPLNDGKKPQEL